jgi:tripartite-type tricarboxylate transporter receptor subunit TctC
MLEAGHADIDGEGWFAFVVPSLTPRDIVSALYRSVVQAIESSAVRPRLPGLGFEPTLSSPDASAARFRSEGEKWSRIIRNAGIKLE